jgi:hypothetical protein
VNISTVAPVVAKEFDIGKTEMRFIFRALVWSYVLFQIPDGWVSDWFGARRMSTGMVAYWSAMTGFTAAASDAASFAAIRFLFGIGVAGAFQLRRAPCPRSRHPSVGTNWLRSEESMNEQMFCRRRSKGWSSCHGQPRGGRLAQRIHDADLYDRRSDGRVYPWRICA